MQRKFPGTTSSIKHDPVDRATSLMAEESGRGPWTAKKKKKKGSTLMAEFKRGK